MENWAEVAPLWPAFWAAERDFCAAVAVARILARKSHRYRPATWRSARLYQPVAIGAPSGWSGLARGGGRLRFLDSLVGDVVRLRGAA